MKRRNFLIGTAGAALGGSALLGSKPFTHVESRRYVSIRVTNDADAHLGMKTLDTPNNNFVNYNGNGDLHINVVEHDELELSGSAAPGEGADSDSFIYFDGLFELCSQGKADATVSYELPPPADRTIGDGGVAPTEGDGQVVAFYWISDDGGRVIVNDNEEVPLGECEAIGLRTVTNGMDGKTDAHLIDGEVVITATAPESGEPIEDGGGDHSNDAPE